MILEELQLIERADRQAGPRDGESAQSSTRTPCERLAEVPGLGVDSAQQIIAEVGATAATFPSPKHSSSWVGACPGDEESAGVNYSHRSPKGNRQMRRILNQMRQRRGQRPKEASSRSCIAASYHAWDTIKTIGAIAHRLCRLIWMILHRGVRYEERGPAVTKGRSKNALRE